MQHDEITSEIRKYLRKLETLAGKVAARPDADDVHAFRVEVKKLRAFIRLTTPQGQSVSRRLPKSIRRFYHSAAVIRNLQLQRQSLADLHDRGHFALPDGLLELLDHRIMAAGKQATRQLHGKRPFGEAGKKLLSGLPERLTGAQKHGFIRTALEALDPRNIPQPPGDEKLHSMRKAIKDLLYAWPYLGSQTRQMASSYLGNHAEMQKAGSLLGDYLDTRLYLLLLHEREGLPDIPPRDRQLLTLIEEEWQRQRDSRRKEVENTLGRRLHFGPHQPELPSKPEGNPLSPGNVNLESNELHIL